MIYKPAYDVNFIIVKFLENWNNKEKHINFRSLLGKIKEKKTLFKKSASREETSFVTLPW